MYRHISFYMEISLNESSSFDNCKIFGPEIHALALEWKDKSHYCSFENYTGACMSGTNKTALSYFELMPSKLKQTFTSKLVL